LRRTLGSHPGSTISAGWGRFGRSSCRRRQYPTIRRDSPVIRRSILVQRGSVISPLPVAFFLISVPGQRTLPLQRQVLQTPLARLAQGTLAATAKARVSRIWFCEGREGARSSEGDWSPVRERENRALFRLRKHACPGPGNDMTKTNCRTRVDRLRHPWSPRSKRLVTTLQHAMDVLQRFSALASPRPREQEKELR
jgi:hypothetical protein